MLVYISSRKGKAIKINMSILQKNDIQKINSPAAIVNFDGELIDANDLLLLLMGNKSKKSVVDFPIPSLFVDTEKYKQNWNELMIKGKIEMDYLTRSFQNPASIKRLVSYIEVLSTEGGNTTILVQHTNDPITMYLSNRYNFLLNEVKQIEPYLNITGKERLKDIINQNNFYKPATFAQNDDKFDRLNSKLLVLNSQELTLCLYLSQHLSTSTISMLTGYSMNAIRVNIHRICIKLGLEGRDHLELYLESI